MLHYLKDHKDNFQNNPKVRLINPAKTNIGQISKIYLQEINSETHNGILFLGIK